MEAIFESPADDVITMTTTATEVLIDNDTEEEEGNQGAVPSYLEDSVDDDASPWGNAISGAVPDNDDEPRDASYTDIPSGSLLGEMAFNPRVSGGEVA